MITEKELDEILVSVEDALSQAESLSKSAPLAKEEVPKEEEVPPQAQPEAPAPEMEAKPEMEAQPDVNEAPAPEAEAKPEMEAPAPEADKELENEAQGGEEITDEELNQIYGSMNPEELERHYMIIRTHLQNAYGNNSEDASKEGQPSEEVSQEQPEVPSQEAAPAVEPQEEEKTVEPAMKEEKKESKEEIEKSETFWKAKFEELEKSVDNKIALAVKAVELAIKPKRKSIEGIEYVAKSEAKAETPKLSNKELKDLVNTKMRNDDFSKSLKKSDRQVINNFMLNDADREIVEKLLFGGK